MDYFGTINSEFEPYTSHMFAIAAMNIENNIRRNIRSRPVSACQDFALVFDENVKIRDDLITKRMINTDQLFQPCTSTLNIVKLAESIPNHIHSKDFVEFQSLASTIFCQLDIESLYELSEFNQHKTNTGKSTEITHKEEFIHSVVLELMHIKSKKIGSKITAEEREESLVKRKKKKQKMVAGH